MEKTIEISKELNTEIGFNPETDAVVFNVNYEGKYGYSKLENGVKLIAILKEIAGKTKNKWDDMGVEALEKLIDYIEKKA